MRNSWQAPILLLLLTAGPNAVADDDFRDPTRPYSAPEYSSVVQSHFEVHAIFSSNKRSVAIVNGRRVTVGSELNDARVLAITKNSVTLDLDGEQVVLTVRGRAARQ